MLSGKRITSVIQNNSAELKQYGVKKIGLFGSFAHSRQNKKSDIDILVEFEPSSKTFDNYMGLKFYLEKIFKRKVDVVIKGALKPAISARVLKEVLYA